MGVMRFLVHPVEALATVPEAAFAYLSGMDGRVFPVRVEVEGNLISCHRTQSDSAKFNVPWPIPGFGRPVVSTTSLRERDQPYHLLLELARGKVAEIRDQAAAWEQANLLVPDAFRDLQRRAFQAFARGSAAQQDPLITSGHAAEALQLAFQAASLLTDAYVIQRMTSLHHSQHHSPKLLGCQLDDDVLSVSGQGVFQHAFNAAGIPFRWSSLESSEGNIAWESVDELVRYCTESRLVCRGGPLVDLSPQGLPEWLAPWKQDFLNLPSFICDFIETAMARYQGTIRLWEVAAYGNTGGALQLTEEQRLAIVARVLESARRTDNNAMLFLRIDQPWGEYQRRGQQRLSPLQFVDALARSNLGLAGVVLEINCGYAPHASYARDMLSISKLIDLWSQIGVQLHVDIACPSGSLPDSRTETQLQILDGAWKSPWSEGAQSEWIEYVVPLLLAKPMVTGVFLSHFSDRLPHRFPNGGLLGADGKPKSMLDPLRQHLIHDLR
ncbi:endo-1,4-beta-xylanase [Planctomicrobium sp. SH664]|uniref:endo-1,4-beta-xylanase n=1 Tax=Planctomicrobium sp. SH664 TaxID=3448125 RepID=UPI003F5C2505